MSASVTPIPVPRPQSPEQIVRRNRLYFDAIKTAAEGWAALCPHSIECSEAMQQLVRSHALGKGNVPRHSEDISRAIIAWCRMRGWEPVDHDHADALALLDYCIAINEKEGGHALKATPLFRDIPT